LPPGRGKSLPGDADRSPRCPPSIVTLNVTRDAAIVASVDARFLGMVSLYLIATTIESGPARCST
jgi:hypothetical protein